MPSPNNGNATRRFRPSTIWSVSSPENEITTDDSEVLSKPSTFSICLSSGLTSFAKLVFQTLAAPRKNFLRDEVYIMGGYLAKSFVITAHPFACVENLPASVIARGEIRLLAGSSLAVKGERSLVARDTGASDDKLMPVQ